MSRAESAMAGRKYMLLIVLLLFCLTLPYVSQAFGFQLDDDEDSKQVVRRRPVLSERKFKFRKIERVYIDEDNAVDNEEDDNGNHEDDGDLSAYERAASEHSRANEEEELQFERVRKAQKKSPILMKSGTREKKDRKKRVHEFDDDDDSTSFLSSLFDSIFGGGSNSKHSEEDSKGRGSAEADASKTNSIIGWLQWLGEKSGRMRPLMDTDSEPEPSSAESLLSYFNRWPFNSLFPIGQPERSMRMSRERLASSEKDNSIEAEPMSQEHFESLLHTLPGFVVNATQVSDVDCRQQLQVFHRQLRGDKLWTLQMLDATGKISSGVLRGNINQFGDPELCTSIKTLVKVTHDTNMRIRGKYCLAHIETHTTLAALKLPVHLAHGRGLWNSHLGNPRHFVPRYSVANWGVCIPHLCSAEAVEQMLEANLGPYNSTGVQFNVEVSDDDCYMRQTKKFTKLMRKDDKFAATVLCVICLALLLLTTLLHENSLAITTFIAKLRFRKATTDIKDDAEAESAETDIGEKDAEVEESTTKTPEGETGDEAQAQSMETSALKQLLFECLKSFSPRHTIAQLLSEEGADVQFPALEALKLVATFMLYVCLKYVMIGHLPITNRDKLVQAFDQPYSILFRAPLIYADTLLLVSGFLTAYQLSEEMEQKTYIQLLKRLTMKITRYLPTLYLVLCFQTWILPHFGSGPLWTSLIGENAQLCDQKMWRNMFGVQNSIDFEETCSPMTIQFGIVMQLYLLAPLIVWLYYTDADAAFFIYGGIHAMSVAARFSRTNREHLSMTVFHGMNVSKFYRTANMLYSSPISRTTPYLLGIGAGILYRTEQGVLDISPEMLPVGWALAILSVLWCYWSPAAGMRTDFMYSTNDAAAYAAWSPLLLGLALCWFIFMWPRRESGNLLSSLTSSRLMRCLSRITLPMQLMMYVIVLYNTASAQEARKYHITELININEIATIVACALLLSFLIDVPVQHIRRLLLDRIFMDRSHQPNDREPTSGADQSEADVSEERSEKVTCDTPEPGETIWASDPEEEEQKYLARRRSSTETFEPKQKSDEEIEKGGDEAEEENDITEEDEVKKRPPTPPPPKPSFTRRRRPTSDD